MFRTLVASFSIKLDSEMVNYKQKVNVYLNGKRIFSKVISSDEQFTIADFKARLDRKAIWENKLAFSVKQGVSAKGMNYSPGF